MLTTGIVFLILALGCAGNGLAQYNVHREYCTLFITDPFKQVISNPGFAWLCAGAIVFVLAALLTLRALSMKKRERAEHKLSYFIAEISTLILGIGSLVFGLTRNAVIFAENTVKLAANPEAATVGYQGTVWIICGAIATFFAFLLLCIQLFKKLSPAFATKVESGKIYGFFRDYRSEMKKIVWSSKKDVIRNTTMVVVILVVTGVLVGALDFGFTRLILLIGGIGA